MEKLIEPKKIYREKRISIPTPEFYVFYNGDAPFPEESFMKLSDAYLEKTDNPMLELIIVDFVRKHGTEAVNMIFTQFNMDDALEVRYEEGIETGEVLKIIR